MWVIQKCLGIVFDYSNHPDSGSHFVLYRLSLLNGRHVVDVLRAVCGPVAVSEAELDRVRRKVTKRARKIRIEGWEGVWSTAWQGAAVTAKE